MTTRKATITLCMAALAAGLLSARTASADPVVKPAGIRIVTVQHGESYSALRPFNARKLGVTVGLLVVADESNIISIAKEDAQKLEAFTDDKGKNLLENSTGFRRDGFEPFSKVSKDGKAALLEVSAGGTPSADAGAIKLKGWVTVQTGREKQPLRSAAFTPEKDAKVGLPGIDFTVKKAGKSNYGDAELAVTLRIERDIPEIAAFRFFDAEGREIKHSGGGSSRAGLGKKVIVERTFHFDKAYPQLIVEVDAWSDMKVRRIPFDLTLGIGAGE